MATRVGAEVGELSDAEINSMMKWGSRGRPSLTWGGCYMRDELTKMDPEHNKYYIVNIADRTKKDQENGTHWTGVFFPRGLKTQAIYFDPYGVEPPEDVLAFMKRSGKRIIVSTFDIQSYYDDACGFYVVYTAKMLQSGKSFLTIMKTFDLFNTWKNRQLVAKLNSNEFFTYLE